MTGAGERPSSEALEASIAETRRRLSATLARLDRDYALRAVLLHGRDVLYPTLAMPPTRELLPLSLVGVGLAWLMLARGNGDPARRLADGLAKLRQLAPRLLAILDK